MAYENKIAIESCIKKVHEQQGTLEKTQLIINELEEVYRKAKAFDEIVIETTGPIMNCPPGTVETEAGRITLDIIEKYDMEDK